MKKTQTSKNRRESHPGKQQSRSAGNQSAKLQADDQSAKQSSSRRATQGKE